MKRRAVFKSICGVGIAGFAGCTDQSGGQNEETPTPTPMPPPVDEMELSIYDVRQPDLGLRSVTLTFILEIANPTERPIPSPSGELDVFINGQRIVTSEPTLNTLEPGETATKSIEVIADSNEIGDSIGNALKEGSFYLELSGLIRSEDATKEVTLDFEY
jgi:hypothetical protein